VHDGKTEGRDPENIGKHPIPRHGFKAASLDPESIRTALSAASEPNWAYCLPEGTFGLDVDGEGIDRLAEMETRFGPLPNTLTDTTANGFHYDFRWPADLPRPRGQLFGFVTRWGGEANGYLIGPNSVHPTGAVYGAIRGPDGYPYPIAELPEAWARAATSRESFTIKATAGQDPETIGIGSRHDWLRDTARLFAGTVRDPDALFAALWVENEKLPEPKTESDVRRAIGDVLEKFPADPVIEARPRGLPERAEPLELPDLADVGSLTTPPDVEAWYVRGFIRPGKLIEIASAEGVGKSSVRKELELRLAVGRGLLMERYPIDHAVRVGTFDEENGLDEEWRREEDLMPLLGITRAELAGRFFRASFLGLNLAEPRSQTYIRHQVETLDLGVLFLDTGGMMVDEEYGPPLKAAIRFLRSLIREHPGLSIVVCVHMVKPIRGPNLAESRRRVLTDVMGQWTRQADVVAAMTDLGANRFRWELVKRRGVPPSAGILDYSDGLTRWVADADAAVDPASTSDTIHVLRCIAAGAGTWQQVKTATGIGRNRVFSAVAELRSDRLIGPGTPYQMTADGQEALG
jgi:hypothetical protein